MRAPFIHISILTAFLVNIFGPLPAQAQELILPKAGLMVPLSPAFTPAHLKGITIHIDNALRFDFLVHKGDVPLEGNQKKEEYNTLIKYFLASLTIPDKDQWVNLSPYENDRIIEESFGKTEMGRDLLGQDYLLKQITASLIYPEQGLGQKFWDTVYERAFKEFGSTNIPVNTFNKVWIVPDKAVVYESGNGSTSSPQVTAYILQSHLKVMLEEDYLSLEKHSGITGQPADSNKAHVLASKIVKEIILPALEKEVNEGKNFAQLRQIYSGMILATWYKKTLKESLLGKVYADKAKVKGVDQDPKANEAIYQQYLTAFKKGVYNYIKEDVDKYTNQTIPRKYFSGGFERADGAMTVIRSGQPVSADVANAAMQNENEAMLGEDEAITADITPQKPNAAREFDRRHKGDTHVVVLALPRGVIKEIGDHLGFTAREARGEFLYRIMERLHSMTVLPKEFIRGYIVRESGQFVPNPLFNPHKYDDALRPDTAMTGARQTLRGPSIPDLPQGPEGVQNAAMTDQHNEELLKQTVEGLNLNLLGHGTGDRGLETAKAILRSGELIHKKGMIQYGAIRFLGVNYGPHDKGTGIFILNPDLTDKQVWGVGDINEASFERRVSLTKIKYIVFSQANANIMRSDPDFRQYHSKIFSYRELAEKLKKDNRSLSKYRSKFISLASYCGELARRLFSRDRAMLSTLTESIVSDGIKNTGGIDLNSANLDLQIKRDGKGVPLPLQFQDMEKLKNIQGFVPVIINIVPVMSLPFLSGLQQKSQPPQAMASAS